MRYPERVRCSPQAVMSAGGHELAGPALMAAIQGVSSTLDDLGVRAGDRVIVGAGNTPAHVIGVLATLASGAIAVPLDASSPLSRLQRLVAHAEGRAAVLAVDSPLSGALGLSELALDPFSAEPASVTPRDVQATPATTAGLLLYTSGSTGDPKGVLLSEGAVAASLAQAKQVFGWTTDTRMLAVLPLHHGHGLLMTALAPLVAGGTVLIDTLDVWGLSGFWDRANKTRATNVSLVPALVQLLVRLSPDRESDSLRLATCASSRLPPALREAFEARFELPLRDCYGMTETSSWCAWPVLAAPSSGVGRPAPGTLRVMGDDGVEAAPGELGRVQVRSPQLFTHYWHNPTATATAYTTDGWFQTGDLGSLDASGALHLRGRSTDVIDRAGMKIYPEEVDEVLCTHPAVSEAATVGVPAELTELPVTFVVLDGDNEAPDLAAWCAERLPGWMCPTRFLFRDALPRSATGKLARGGLQREAAMLFSEKP